MNMMALQFNYFELSNVVTSLGKLLRYTVNAKINTVHLLDEILFVESYLQIQSLRLRDQLRTEIWIDPSIESCLVPKLILQPLVENVIEHGLAELVVTIRLTAEIDGDQLNLL